MKPNIKSDDEVREVGAPPETILDKVNYAYSSYAQFTSSNHDFRIAFGDRIPPDGNVKPVFGVVMSHDHARSFLQAMTRNMAKLEDALLKLKKIEESESSAKE